MTRLPDLELISRDRLFLVRCYRLARRLANDPATTPRKRLALNAYATAACTVLLAREGRP
jgi:hypothetical protein